MHPKSTELFTKESGALKQTKKFSLISITCVHAGCNLVGKCLFHMFIAEPWFITCTRMQGNKGLNTKKKKVSVNQ